MYEGHVSYLYHRTSTTELAVQCNQSPTPDNLTAIYQYMEAVAPVAYQVNLEPGIGQFREFESPIVHTRINS